MRWEMTRAISGVRVMEGPELQSVLEGAEGAFHLGQLLVAQGHVLSREAEVGGGE